MVRPIGVPDGWKRAAIALIVVGLATAAFAAVSVARREPVCSEAKRAALLSVPSIGGVHPRVTEIRVPEEAAAGPGGCRLVYTVDASIDEVGSHYKTRLLRRGWDQFGGPGPWLRFHGKLGYWWMWAVWRGGDASGEWDDLIYELVLREAGAEGTRVEATVEPFSVGIGG